MVHTEYPSLLDILVTGFCRHVKIYILREEVGNLTIGFQCFLIPVMPIDFVTQVDAQIIKRTSQKSLCQGLKTLQPASPEKSVDLKGV